MSEIFVTSTGVEITLKNISPALMAMVRTSVEFPKRPTYEAKTVAGDIEVHEHDETTLETDEDREAWDRYLVEFMQAEQERALRVGNALFKRGIDYEALELPEDDRWIKEQKELGVKVPKDPLERKRHWLETEAFTTEDDIRQLSLRLMALSGTPEEVIAAVERSFRGEVEGDAAGEPEDRGGSVELQHDLPGDDGETGVGEDG